MSAMDLSLFDQLMEEGKKLAAEGKVNESLRKFQSAREIQETPKVVHRIQKLKDFIHQYKTSKSRPSSENKDVFSMSINSLKEPAAGSAIPSHTDQLQNSEIRSTSKSVSAACNESQNIKDKVIQQPLITSILQHLYSQEQMLLSGNLNLQPAAMVSSIQSLDSARRHLQLQAKTPLPTTFSGGAQNLQGVNASLNSAHEVGLQLQANTALDPTFSNLAQNFQTVNASLQRFNSALRVRRQLQARTAPKFSGGAQNLQATNANKAQVTQQPLPASYNHNLFQPQHFPGNFTLQNAGMPSTLEKVASALRVLEARNANKPTRFLNHPLSWGQAGLPTATRQQLGQTTNRRLNLEYMRFLKDPVPYVKAHPLPQNILEWHFALLGPDDTPYEGGVYHGKLVFPGQYPIKPPSIFMITPNGRFRCNVSLCVTGISSHHPETWCAAWSVSAILKSFLSFMVDERSDVFAYYLNSSPKEKILLASKSLEFNLKNPIFCEQFSDLVKITANRSKILVAEEINIFFNKETSITKTIHPKTAKDEPSRKRKLDDFIESNNLD